MLYFKALMDGLDDLPTADPAVRQRLDAEACRHWLARDARPAGPGRSGHRRPLRLDCVQSIALKGDGYWRIRRV